MLAIPSHGEPSNNLICFSHTAKHDIVSESQLPHGMSGEKLKELEKGPVSVAPPEEAPGQPPKFVTQIKSSSVTEGEPVQFECRVEPKTDPDLQVRKQMSGKTFFGKQDVDSTEKVRVR